MAEKVEQGAILRLGPGVRELATHYGFTAEEICGKRRDRKLATVRSRIMAELRKQGFSYPHIGRLLNRHHTTIMRGIRHWDKLQEQK